mmetsp:Transcript_5496/g.8588  ORF Transcript_5496/g.8588 Transcript_5496/m.8588 type:complete len:140 (+) Transcript_5496:369-788(+)
MLSRRRTIGPDSVPNLRIETIQKEKKFDNLNRNSPSGRVNSNLPEGQEPQAHNLIEDAEFVELLEDFPSLKSVLHQRYRRIKEKLANQEDLDDGGGGDDPFDTLAESRIEKRPKGGECFKKITNFFKSDIDEPSDEESA